VRHPPLRIQCQCPYCTEIGRVRFSFCWWAALQITLSDIQVDEEAVEQAMARIAVSPAPSGEEVPETLKALFSFLVQTPSDKLVETRPHAGTRWHLDQIYLLDDCVAAQFAEGHYMETVFFVRNRRGWRIAGRIRPGDHQ